MAQPLAGAWLRAIPGPSQFRLRSSLYVIALQRWLGLPIHMASAANVAAAETLGDEELKGCEHTTRHNRVVAAWVRAVQAARGAAHTRATAEAPAWSAPSVPDFVSEYAGQAGAHQAGEVKVYNTIIADAAQLLRGATQAFGATRARLLAENLGDYAPSEVVAPRSDGVARTAKLQAWPYVYRRVRPKVCPGRAWLTGLVGPFLGDRKSRGELWAQLYFYARARRYEVDG